MELSTILFQIVLILIVVLLYINKRYSYWSDRGIKGPLGLPFLGNFWETVWKGQLVCELEWMEKYAVREGRKYYGSWNFSKPTLTIIDAELIKQVMVKDFNLFVNRRKNRSDHEIWSRNLFGIENDDWKRIRTITSPSFTSGKLKNMTVMMNICVDRMLAYFDQLCDTTDGVINTKKVVSGFSIDVIAQTSFATETNANGDRAEENAFVVNGLNAFKAYPLRIIGLALLPAFIRRLFGFTLNLDPTTFNFFVQLSRAVIKERRENPQSRRTDLVQLLMNSRVSESDLKESNYGKLSADMDNDENFSTNFTSENQKTDKSLTDNEIIAQCILFFAAGFDTTSSTLSHCLFEFARNPETQERLFEELQELNSLDANSDELYDKVMNRLPYLDAVIKETLRLYPPVPRLNRRVNIDGYKLDDVLLTKDMGVEIPAYSIMRSPEYYPEPERFNPERFMPENKHLLVPYTWLPFGAGPRNCVGMRFAYQEMKLFLAQVLRRFQFSPTSKTPDKMNFSKLGLMSVKNFPLKVSRR